MRHLLNYQSLSSPPAHNAHLGSLSSPNVVDQFSMSPERGRGEVRLHGEVVGVLHAATTRRFFMSGGN